VYFANNVAYFLFNRWLSFQRLCCLLGGYHYRAMLCIRCTSHGPVSVCVYLSQVDVLLKWLNVGSHKQHHTIAQGIWFSDARDHREIRLTGVPNAGGVGQNQRLLTNNRLCLENSTSFVLGFY